MPTIVTLRDIDRFRDEYALTPSRRGDNASFIVRTILTQELILAWLPAHIQRGDILKTASGEEVSTVIALLHPDEAEVKERLFKSEFADGIHYCDTAYEVRGDYKQVALLPKSKVPFRFNAIEWKGKCPRWMNKRILADVAQRALEADVLGRKADEEVKSILQ